MHTALPGRAARTAGVVLTALVVLFLLFDAGAKIAMIRPVIEGTTRLGYPGTFVRPLGLVLLACTLLYASPRTAVLGGLLLTGYLGGAVATHARLQHPPLTHTLFPVFTGVVLWLGLLLRDQRLRNLLLPRDRTMA